MTHSFSDPFHAFHIGSADWKASKDNKEIGEKLLCELGNVTSDVTADSAAATIVMKEAKEIDGKYIPLPVHNVALKRYLFAGAVCGMLSVTNANIVIITNYTTRLEGLSIKYSTDLARNYDEHLRRKLAATPDITINAIEEAFSGLNKQIMDDISSEEFYTKQKNILKKQQEEHSARENKQRGKGLMRGGGGQQYNNNPSIPSKGNKNQKGNQSYRGRGRGKGNVRSNTWPANDWSGQEWAANVNRRGDRHSLSRAIVVAG